MSWGTGGGTRSSVVPIKQVAMRAYASNAVDAASTIFESPMVLTSGDEAVSFPDARGQFLLTIWSHAGRSKCLTPSEPSTARQSPTAVGLPAGAPDEPRLPLLLQSLGWRLPAELPRPIMD